MFSQELVVSSVKNPQAIVFPLHAVNGFVCKANGPCGSSAEKNQNPDSKVAGTGKSDQS